MTCLSKNTKPWTIEPSQPKMPTHHGCTKTLIKTTSTTTYHSIPITLRRFKRTSSKYRHRTLIPFIPSNKIPKVRSADPKLVRLSTKMLRTVALEAEAGIRETLHSLCLSSLTLTYFSQHTSHFLPTSKALTKSSPDT
jgi:hypothetical protein